MQEVAVPYLHWLMSDFSYHGWLVLKCLTQMKSVGKKWLLNAIQFWNVVDGPLCQKSLTGREIQRFAHKFYKVGETERLISLHTNFRRWDVFVEFCPLVHFDRKTTTTTKLQTFLKILCLTFLLFLLVFFPPFSSSKLSQLGWLSEVSATSKWPLC